MRRRAFAIGLAVAVTITVTLPASASGDNAGPIITPHPLIAASLERLASGSAAWRDALEAVAATGRHAIVVTPDRVRVRDAAGKGVRPFDEDVLAEVQPLADNRSQVHIVIVVVNVPLLEEMHASGVPAEFENDLDRILAHEVYGHAIPYLLAGNMSGKCADPLPGQRATDACAIKRENEIRSELRLGERRGYGLDGLAMTRRFRY